MSDKLVSLGAVKELFKRIPANMPFEIAECLLNERLNDLPAVPKEMSAREYLVTEARMFKHYGLPCAFDVSGLTVDEAIEMVENFAREHPEERSEE